MFSCKAVIFFFGGLKKKIKIKRDAFVLLSNLAWFGSPVPLSGTCTACLTKRKRKNKENKVGVGVFFFLNGSGKQ